MLSRLELVDQGLLAVLISDRDTKFPSKLGVALFTKFGVELIDSTAYHPQTDSSSVRTNQTIEIALHFLVHLTPNVYKWLLQLPRIQSLLTNTSSSMTGKSPNEIVYGSMSQQQLDMLMPIAPSDKSAARTAASDGIAFDLMAHKNHYDHSRPYS